MTMKGLTAATVLLTTIAPPTLAQAANCADRETITERLDAHYDEQLTAGGLQTIRSKQTLVEVWSSTETGTFTVLITRPDGLSCVIATGTEWHQTKPTAVTDEPG